MSGSRQQRRDFLAQQRGYRSAYAERVAKGQAKGLTAAQAVGKAPRAVAPAGGATTPTTGVRVAQTAAGTVYRAPAYDVGRLSTIIANVDAGRRVQFVLTDTRGGTHPLYGKGGRRAGAIRADIAAAGGFDQWLTEEADNVAGAGGSDWRTVDIAAVTMTVGPK